jgi:hypothetical protein
MTSYHGGKQRIGKDIAQVIYDEAIDIQYEEVFRCSSCKLEIDRDVTGSRNILIKNTSLR